MTRKRLLDLILAGFFTGILLVGIFLMEYGRWP